MATLPDVMATLVQQVTNATENLTINSNSVNVEVGEGWPNIDARQDVARGGIAVVGVYHKMTNYSKPYFPYTRAYVDNPVGIKSDISNGVIGPGDSATITLSLANGSTQVNIDDAVSAYIQNSSISDAGVGIATAGETLATLATKLAVAINSRSPINTWVSAVASGPQVTLTNNSNNILRLNSYVGNTRSLTQSVQTAHRNIQIIVWSGDKDIRDTVGIRINTLLASLEDNYGFQTLSGELIRVFNQGERSDDQNMQSDIYRVDYQVLLEHSVDMSEEAWSVLAPISDLQKI